MVSYKDRLHVVGGIVGGGESTSMEFFDGVRWNRGPSMRTPRAAVAAAVCAGKIYVVGGSNGLSGQCMEMNSVEAFDGTQWNSAPTKP